jgi:exodeoxyribonuclease V alpha subunit
MAIISIKSITFYNPENHYAIIKDYNDDYYQGNIFYPYKEQKLEVQSEFIMTAYGKQQKITFVKYFAPKTSVELVNLLTSGLIPKVGQKTALKITENIIADTFLDELELQHININQNLKSSLKNKLMFYKNFIVSNLKFTEKGFQQDSIIKITELFGEKALSILETNPYIFYKKIPLLTFGFIDKVAESYQLSRHSKERILAGTFSCIEDYCNENKCSGIEFNNLCKTAGSFLEIDDGIYYATLNHLLDEKELCEITIDNQNLISTPQIYYTELGIANQIKRLKNGSVDKNKFIATLPDFLSDNQVQAIEDLLNNKVSILTGMPGSGKTTIIQYVIKLFEKQYPEKIVYIGTPTGKSAQRVRETDAKLNVSTNHKLLGFLPDGSFLHNENNKLKVDLVILDETSMVDIFMFHSLLKAIPNNAQVLIIGDPNQLPSIQLGNVLLDLIESKVIIHKHLHEVFRQKENSNILNSAMKVINKEIIKQPENNKDQDFYFFNKTIEKDIAKVTIDLFFKIKQNKQYALRDLQILCPQKTSLCGVDYLNNEIQSILFQDKKSIKWKDKEFFEGDKVIQNINDYDRNIFNGDIGFIKSFSTTNYQIIIDCDGSEVIYEKSQIEQLELAYAITIHKFQGSECKGIIMPITKSFSRMLTPKLIYTGMTRAKELLVLSGDLNIFNHSIKYNEDIERKTFLQFFLLNELNECLD